MGGGLSVLTSVSLDDLPVTDPVTCQHKFCEKWGPGHFHCADCHTTITNEALMADEDRIIDGIIDESVPEDGVYRGVTIQFLVDFANACKCWDMTTREVRRRYVMPATRATRCRFVELPEMKGIVGKATTFVSHTWGAKFGDLVAALCDGKADRNRIVWVDIFAVRQWPSHKPDLDFSAVVRQCKSFMVVCSSLPEVTNLQSEDMVARNISAIPPHVRAQIAFLRVWCLVEIHAAIQSGATIVMKAGTGYSGEGSIFFEPNADMLSNMVYLIDINNAEATVISDKARLLKDINAAEGGIPAVNSAVSGLIAGAFIACDHPVVQCAACGDEEATNSILKNPGPLMSAVAGSGYIELLRQMIAKGGDVNAVSTDNLTPVEAAAGGGHAACLELLIQSGATVSSELSDDVTILAMTVVGGHAACAEVLVKHGVDLNVQMSSGCSALMLAAKVGRVDCVKLLLRSGCDVNLKDSEGQSALDIAREWDHPECVELLK